MEDLIPFLFFIIVGLLSFIGKLKEKKKKKQRAKALGGEGLAFKIRAWLTDLQKRIETQSKKTPGGERGWEQLIGRPQSVGTHTLPNDAAPEDVDLDAAGETLPPLPKGKPSETSPQLQTTIPTSEEPEIAAVEIPRMLTKAKRKTTPTVLPADRSGLRQAVVWSEILGPPVALREPFRDHR